MGEVISSVAGPHDVVDDWGDRDNGGGNNHDRGIKCEAGDAGIDVYENHPFQISLKAEEFTFQIVLQIFFVLLLFFC